MTHHSQEPSNLVALEQRIDELIGTLDKLSKENSALRTQQNNLFTERAKLIEKNEQAQRSIEKMISRLRVMEESP